MPLPPPVDPSAVFGSYLLMYGGMPPYSSYGMFAPSVVHQPSHDHGRHAAAGHDHSGLAVDVDGGGGSDQRRDFGFERSLGGGLTVPGASPHPLASLDRRPAVLSSATLAAAVRPSASGVAAPTPATAAASATATASASASASASAVTNQTETARKGDAVVAVTTYTPSGPSAITSPRTVIMTASEAEAQVALEKYLAVRSGPTGCSAPRLVCWHCHTPLATATARPPLHVDDGGS